VAICATPTRRRVHHPEQLAKISFLQDNGSLAYKIKEIILGTELVNDFSKDQILDMYLNRIPYGNQAIGIQTAAELYFHEPASALDLAQSAMLAGLPQPPRSSTPTSTRGRQAAAGAVLQAMVGWEASPGPGRRGSRRAAQVLHVEQYLPPTIINGANTTSFLNYLTAYYLPASSMETASRTPAATTSTPPSTSRIRPSATRRCTT